MMTSGTEATSDSASNYSLSKGSLRDVSKESDHERLIYLLIGRALCGEPKVLLQRLAMFARAPCHTCLSKLKSSVSQEELQNPRRKRSRRTLSTISFHSDCCSSQHKALLGALDHWVAAFPRDFTQRDFLDRFNEICQMVGHINSEDEAESRRLSWRASNAVTSPQPIRRNNFHNKSMSLMRNRSHPARSYSPLKQLCGDLPCHLAEHLTYLELNQMDKIHPSEIVEMVMARERGGTALSNVNQYIQWSNRLSHIVASEVVSCHKVSDRVEMLEFFMDAALTCCRLGNFNSCVSLTAGLSLPVIQRLTKTWSKIEDTKLRVLQHICDPKSNFRNYRVILKMFDSENQTPVLVPMFSVFLKDCYFRLKPCVDNSETDTDRQLQCWKDLARPIADFSTWRSKRIQLTKREKLINYLSSCSAFEESVLFDYSFAIERPNNSFEKSQKRLIRNQSTERTAG